MRFSSKPLVALFLPIVGYGIWAAESVFAFPNRIWALFLFFWSVGAGVLAWEFARGRASVILNSIERHASAIVKILIEVACCVLIVASIVQSRQFAFSVNSEDTAYYSQVFWNTLNGKLLNGNLQQERIYNPPVSSDLALHVSPALVGVLLPIYAVFPDFITLLIVRDVFLVVAAWPLFLLARERIGGIAGIAAVILYLCNPSVIAQGFESFNLLQLAPLPFFWALRAFDRSEFRQFLFWAGMAICVREEVAITVAGFGLWALLTKRPLRWSITSLVIPVVWWVIVTLVIQPYFGRVGNSALDAALAGKSEKALGIYHVLLGSPKWFIDALLQGGLEYLYRLLRPVGLLGVLGQEGILAAPGLLANLFLARVYYGGSDPFGRFAILPSCAFVGVAVLVVTRLGRRYHWDMVPFAAIMLFLLPSVSLLDGAKDALESQLRLITLNNNPKALREAVKLIPDDGSVAAPAYALPVLSKRSKLYYLQHLHAYPHAQPGYILLDGDIDRITTNPKLRERYISLIDTLSRSPEYETLWQSGEYSLLHRIGRP